MNILLKDILKNNQKGMTTLLMTMLCSVVLMLTIAASLTISSGEQNYTYSQANKIKARYIAEAGITRAVKYIQTTYMKREMSYLSVDTNLTDLALYKKEPFFLPNGSVSVKTGEYDVSIRLLKPDEISISSKDVTNDTLDSIRYLLVTAVAYVPSSDHPKSTATIQAVYEMSTMVAQVFDYAYFINNWGWLYGNNIVVQGNVRSNGSFSMGNYRPEIWGKPRFETSNGYDLIGYIDDNKDGQLNNQDGGIYAWNSIQGIPSTVGHPADLYAGQQGQSLLFNVPQLPMPNLTQLSNYEKIAKEGGSYIKVGGTVICDGVWGDNEGKQNLYLEGTYEKPVEIYGTVVVRGDLIIRGYITGQGSIYCGRNIYIPQRVLYRNNVSQRQPSTNSESSREDWRLRNQDKDILGLFARENIVLGDFTSSTWQSKVYNWINNPNNKSKEDAGIDKIPNTKDPGEDDGVWTVERDIVTGEIIPGSGEDIDGDGKFDDTTQLKDFDLSTGSFYSGHSGWGGNIPPDIKQFRDVTYWNDTSDNPGIATGSTLFPQVDGILYTNHFLGGYISNSTGYNYKDDNREHFVNSQEIIFFGAVISRNESLIYNARTLYFYHDDRISSSSGKLFNFVLPRIWNDLKLVSMEIR